MKDMLDAVDHRRPIRAFKNVHDTLETENIVPQCSASASRNSVSATARIGSRRTIA
jgi:hypothetical protein